MSWQTKSSPKSKTINFGFFAAMLENRCAFTGKSTENHNSVFSSDLHICMELLAVCVFDSKSTSGHFGYL